MTRINQATKLLIAVPTALAIASCSATEDTTADTAAGTGGKVPTVTASIGGAGADTAAQGADLPETVTQEKTVTEAAAQPPAGEAAAPPAPAPAPEGDNCASLPTDPRQQYATGTAPGRMPAADSQSDMNYWIENIENHYDPCAPISWITFRGSLGDGDRPAGTGASISDGLALYVNGQPAGDMRLFTEVESIELLNDGQLRLSWGERGEATAAGITDHYTVDLTAQGDAVQPVAGDVEQFNRFWNQSGYLLN